MSASNKKKLRKEQNAAAMTEKQQKALKEAKKLKAYTLSFVVVMVLIVAIIIGVAVRPAINGLIDRNTHAITIAGHELSIADFTYYYIDAINAYYSELYSMYGSYTQYLLGFSMSQPLNEQTYDKETGETWADYFMNQAIESAKSTLAMYNLAISNNHAMTEEEQQNLKETLDGLNDYAKSLKYSSAVEYLQQMYGRGAEKASFDEYYTISAMANSYYNKHMEELEESYKPEDFRAHETDKVGHYSSYTFATHQITVKDYLGEGTKDDKGNVTYTDEQKAAALEAAKKDVQFLLDYGINDVESFNAALEELQKLKAEAEKDETTEPSEPSTDASEPSEPSEPATEPSTSATETTGSSSGSTEEVAKKVTCVENEELLYSNVTATLQEWISSADRKPGEVDSVEITQTVSGQSHEGHKHAEDEECTEQEKEVTGFYIVLFQDVETNEYFTVDVRHVLIAFQGGKQDASTGKTTYTDEEKNAAKEKAEKLYNEWKAAGKLDSESFAELANKNSTDTGSNTNGGLYENVYHGWAVDTFDDWCFEEGRKAGDHGLIESERGYHIMFLEEVNDITYRDHLIKNEMLKEDMEEWHDSVVEKVTVTKVDLSRMAWDLVLG